MRKAVFIVGMLLSLCVIANAQDAPKVEIFGGYSYLRADDADELDLHGWNASAAVNFKKCAGIVADFSGHYDDIRVSPTVKVDLNSHLFLIGPRFTYRNHKVLSPFGHVLVGAARSRAKTSTPIGNVEVTDTAFALAAGGGLDIVVHPRVALRLFQADYILTRFDDDSQHNFRVSTGLVLRLGSQ